MEIWEEEFLNIRKFIIFLSYTIVELIILLLVNFILEKSFRYCTNVHSYIGKGNKYISTYKSQCFKDVYDFMLYPTRCCAGPHAPRGPRIGQPWCKILKIAMTKWGACPCLFFYIPVSEWVTTPSPSHAFFYDDRHQLFFDIYVGWSKLFFISPLKESKWISKG